MRRATPPAAAQAASPGAWLTRLPLIAAAAALAVPAVMLVLARRGGAEAAFPLDDAWIHLTFARNLARHGAFAYFPGDGVTTGSTAPLFTLLEAAGFLITSNERVIAFVLGIVAYAAFLIVTLRDAARAAGSPVWAAFTIALIAGDSRFGILAASGMETTLFVAALALVFAAWRRGDARVAAIFAGAAVWVRPEALLLAPILSIDALLARRRPTHALSAALCFAGLVGAYLAFHRLTAGAGAASSWFPTTLAAKAAYYGGRSRMEFMQQDVAATFGGGWLLLAPFVAYALLCAVRELGSREPRAPRAELAWVVAVVVAYAIVLPFAHRFDRYLVPVLPAYAFVGVWGLRDIAARLPRLQALAPAVAAGSLITQALWFAPGYTGYVSAARYHASHHVRTGRWIALNTPGDAVVATHDIGAIAFEGQRRIVDMAGLVTPEVIPHLRTPGYAAWMESLFVRRHVTYVAVLHDWQSVEDAEPVFDADPEPEWLRVYAWSPGGAHLVSNATVSGEKQALTAMQAGRTDVALTTLRRVLAGDPRAGVAWSLYGAALTRAGQADSASAALHVALGYDPQLADARFALGALYVQQGRWSDARAQLDSLRAFAPAHPGVDWLRAQLAGH